MTSSPLQTPYMSPKPSEEEFSQLFEKFYQYQQNQSPLALLKEKWWLKFLEKGFPDRRNDAFRYLPLSQLYHHLFVMEEPAKSLPQIPTMPKNAAAQFVFVNGVFIPSLSQTDKLPSSLYFAPLSSALRTYGAFIQNRTAMLLKNENDPFACLNGALQTEPLFLYCPPKVIVEEPIVILNYVTKGEAPLCVAPRIQLFAGKEAQLQLSCMTISENERSYFSNQLIDIALEENAQLHLSLIETPPAHAWSFQSIRAQLKRNSRFTSTSGSSGSKTHRQSYHAILLEENAQCDLNGLWMNKDQCQTHTHVLIEHLAPHCQSRQLFKGALTDQSRSSFEGKIYVHSEAQKTDAFQRNNNLILSNQAIAYSKPNLEILADDVKASHGATFGQLSENELFYLQTRGLSKSLASKLLIKGFTDEIVDQLPLPQMQAAMAVAIAQVCEKTCG
ncbi:MAG: Fe-S cluster assembly protein SufD [Parachlamydiales bacterium]|nr:Fe-S cluster assembly protein SufD [Parachlamydiales bacterium]